MRAFLIAISFPLLLNSGLLLGSGSDTANRFQTGQDYVRKGQLERARQVFTAISEERPTNEFTLKSLEELAAIEFGEKKYSRAARYWERAIIFADDPRAIFKSRYNQALCFARLERPEDALDVLHHLSPAVIKAAGSDYESAYRQLETALKDEILPLSSQANVPAVDGKTVKTVRFAREPVADAPWFFTLIGGTSWLSYASNNTDPIHFFSLSYAGELGMKLSGRTEFYVSVFGPFTTFSSNNTLGDFELQSSLRYFLVANEIWKLSLGVGGQYSTLFGSSPGGPGFADEFGPLVRVDATRRFGKYTSLEGGFSIGSFGLSQSKRRFEVSLTYFDMYLYDNVDLGLGARYTSAHLYSNNQLNDADDVSFFVAIRF